MSSLDNFLNKKYRFVKADENFDEYLKAIGCNYLTRKVAKSVPSYSEIIKLSDEEYGFVTSVPFKTVTQKFIPGVEITQATMDGRTVRNTFEIEGNKLIEYQVEDSRKITLIREYFHDKMLGNSIFNGDMTSKHISVFEEK